METKMVSHPRIYLQQLKKALHLHPLPTAGSPERPLCVPAGPSPAAVSRSHSEGEPDAAHLSHGHHPLYSLQITAQTIAQVQLAKALITKGECVKDIER